MNIAISSAKERKQAEEQYYNSVISQQQQYNILLNEQIGLQGKSSGSIFYTDFEKEISSGFAKAKDAQEKGMAAMEALQNGKAKDGQKNGIDWKKVGAGAISGAGAGAIAGAGVFSWAGAAIGGIAGAIGGLFSGMKKKDTFTPLLTAWPGLIDESKSGLDSFNSVLAQTLIDNNLVDEATKRTLQSTIEWKEQLKEAQEQIKGVISDLSGALGDDLRDGLVNAFRDGQDAAEAFGNSVTKILENILEQMIFSKVLGPALDKLEANMNASIAPGGDGSWIDDFGQFFALADQLTAANNAALEEAQKAASAYGIKLWEPSDSKKSSDPLQGAIQGMTEQTAGILSGQFTALRMTSADSNVQLRGILLGINNISINSNYLPLLASIDSRLASLKTADSFNREYGGQ